MLGEPLTLKGGRTLTVERSFETVIVNLERWTRSKGQAARKTVDVTKGLTLEDTVALALDAHLNDGVEAAEVTALIRATDWGAGLP